MTPKRKALLIQPQDIRWFWGWSPPPVGLLSLAAAAPGTRVIDCAQTGIDEAAALDAEQPDIVGVTAFSSTRHAALRLLEEAKRRGCTTVMGGPHVADARIARQVAAHYPFVDYIVRGDGEAAWADIVAGRPRPRVSLDYCRDLDSLTPPGWKAVDIMAYPPRDEGMYHGVDLASTPRVSVVFSRGCPGRCNFCRAWRRPFRQHSPAWIRRMLTPLADMGVRHLCIDDDCWATDEAEALAICEVLHDLGFVWSAETRADLLTPELAVAMEAAGCWQVAVGLEHGSARMLQVINKGIELQDVLNARHAAWDAGLKFFALMLTGYPGETEADREACAAFISALDPDDVGTLGATLILPGTQLYADALASGAVTDDIWLQPGRHLMASPNGPQMWGD